MIFLGERIYVGFHSNFQGCKCKCGRVPHRNMASGTNTEKDQKPDTLIKESEHILMRFSVTLWTQGCIENQSSNPRRSCIPWCAFPVTHCEPDPRWCSVRHDRFWATATFNRFLCHHISSNVHSSPKWCSNTPSPSHRLMEMVSRHVQVISCTYLSRRKWFPQIIRVNFTSFVVHWCHLLVESTGLSTRAVRALWGCEPPAWHQGWGWWNEGLIPHQITQLEANQAWRKFWIHDPPCKSCWKGDTAYVIEDSAEQKRNGNVRQNGFTTT